MRRAQVGGGAHGAFGAALAERRHPRPLLPRARAGRVPPPAFLRNKLYLLDLIIVSPISPPLSRLYLPYISPNLPILPCSTHHRHKFLPNPNPNPGRPNLNPRAIPFPFPYLSLPVTLPLPLPQVTISLGLEIALAAQRANRLRARRPDHHRPPLAPCASACAPPRDVA